MHRRTFMQFGLTVPAAAVLSSPARAQSDLPVIRVAAPATEDSTNVYYAVRANLFKPVGLDVQLFHTTSGSAAVAAVVSGAYEIAASSLIAILNGHLRGIPLVVVAPENMFDARDPLFSLLPDSDRFERKERCRFKREDHRRPCVKRCKYRGGASLG